MTGNEILRAAEKVFEIEAAALQNLKSKLGSEFIDAVDALYACRGKVIVSGMGKSGLIGRKISATLSSTGTPSVFLHPAECAHGDLGVVAEGDVVLAISYGGESTELNSVIQYAARKGIALVAMTGQRESSLGKAARVVLDIGVEMEACPLGLAPTTSTTVTLAMGDALAVALMKKKGVKEEKFAEFHPGGKLGRRLLTKVSDVMHAKEAMPLVRRETSMKEVISEMTRREVRGVAGVVDDNGFLIGVVTDGDIRRSLEQQSQNPLLDVAGKVMSQNPKTIDQDELAEKALFVMEQFQIQTLFAVERVRLSDGSIRPRPVGLLHIQDLLRAKIR